MVIAINKTLKQPVFLLFLSGENTGKIYFAVNDSDCSEP
jgi:hypothetical protein